MLCSSGVNDFLSLGLFLREFLSSFKTQFKGYFFPEGFAVILFVLFYSLISTYFILIPVILCMSHQKSSLSTEILLYSPNSELEQYMIIC